MIIAVKSLGNDEWSRPTLQNIETGNLYVDINCGDGVPDWHVCTNDGEPLARVGKEVVFEVVEESEPDEDHITFFDGDGKRIDCCTVDRDASDRFVWELFGGDLNHFRTSETWFEREPHTGEC